MGVVYRATDTKLNREVALKFLPEPFASDHERMARFHREAQVLASLNHPNIATIHGLEESGPLRALVMELVEGPTLADRIVQGALPLEEVLPTAKQIAEALEYAHERGIVHRDLKPANVKLTREGHVKVLDFGLAKALGDDASPTNLSNSPTLSLAPTQAGIILGTAAYMPPEQAKGKPVDRRADIWAFGVVVYEMLTGKTLFTGETVSETLAYVMTREPDWTALPPNAGTRLRELLRRCLTKDPRNRLRDIGDARVAIEELIAKPETEAHAPQPLLPADHAPVWRGGLPWAAAVTGILAAAAALWAPWQRPAAPQSVMQFSAELGVDASLTTDFGSSVVLSPDGKLLAFVARPSAGGPPHLYLRRLDQLQVTALAGTEEARDPFFSPDGQWIGFFASGRLKKISVTGGAAVTVADAADDRGGTWAEDGTIIFARGGPGSVLQRVSADGGTPSPLTTLDRALGEINHRWPHAFPGGQAVLFTASVGAYENTNVVLQPLPSGNRKVLQRGGNDGRYLPSGHVVYVQEATLFAAPFDLGRLELSGQPVPVVEGLTSSFNRGAMYSVSENGSLVFLPGTSVDRGRFLIDWMERSGKTQPLRTTTANYGMFGFSPDGRRLAIDLFEQDIDIWVYESARDTMSRLTFDQAEDRSPVWTPDGQRIAFASRRVDGVTPNIYWQRSDGTGEPQRLTENRNGQYPSSWHPNGKLLAFRESRTGTNGDILILPVEGDEASGWKPGKPSTFLESPFNETEAVFSPDGKWLAYESDESDRIEVYVRPFPGPGGKWQISTAGGEFPTWSRNGKELFYRTADQRIWVATYTAAGDSFRADKARLWSEGTFADRGSPRSRNFDLHADGQRFAVLRSARSQSDVKLDKVVFVLNFFDELRRIAPVPQR